MRIVAEPCDWKLEDFVQIRRETPVVQPEPERLGADSLSQFLLQVGG